MRAFLLSCLLFLSLHQIAWAWGAIVGVAETHNDIVRSAYHFLEINDPFVIDELPPIQAVLDNDYVLLLGPNGPLTGPGPDSEGASLYSFHYYNPRNPAGLEGNGPSSIAHYFEDLVRNKYKLTSRYPIEKCAAWASHYLADMNVPYHVIGAPASEVYGGKLGPLLDEAVFGGHYLYSITEYLGNTLEPPMNWGFDNNFSNAISFFIETYPKGSKGDWFDPWYLNGLGNSVVPIGKEQRDLSDIATSMGIPNLSGNVVDQASVVGGSHAFWEFFAARNYPIDVVEARLMELSANASKYHPRWEGNGAPEWGDQFFINQNEKVVEFAKKVARQTRSNLEAFWKVPKEPMARAVWAVATMLRASVSGLTIHDPKVYPIDHKGQKLEFAIMNQSNYPVQRIKARLTMDDESIQEKVIRTELKKGAIRSLRFDIYPQSSGIQRGVLELIGEYNDVPDLGYKKCEFQYFADEVSDLQHDGSDDAEPIEVETSEIELHVMDAFGELDDRFAWGDKVFANVPHELISGPQNLEVTGQWQLKPPSGQPMASTPQKIVLPSIEVPKAITQTINIQENSEYGLWRISMESSAAGDVCSSRASTFSVVPLYTEPEIWISNLANSRAVVQSFQPGDKIVFNLEINYNGHNPEIETQMSVQLSGGNDSRIQTLNSIGTHYLKKGQVTLFSEGVIPNFINAGFYSVTIQIRSGESSVQLSDTFKIDYPVRFDQLITTDGNAFNQKLSFKEGESFGYAMNYEFEEPEEGDQYQTRFLCFYNGQLMENLSTPLSPMQSINPFQGIEHRNASGYLSSGIPQGTYELQGLIVLNGTNYTSAKVNFFIEEEEEQTIVIEPPAQPVNEFESTDVSECPKRDLENKGFFKMYWTDQENDENNYCRCAYDENGWLEIEEIRSNTGGDLWAKKTEWKYDNQLGHLLTFSSTKINGEKHGRQLMYMIWKGKYVKSFEGDFYNGKEQGVHRRWDHNGKRESYSRYEDGNLLEFIWWDVDDRRRTHKKYDSYGNERDVPDSEYREVEM